MLPGMPAGMPIGDVLRMVAPALLGVQAGSMIGYLAQHAFGRYDLPLPTGAPPDGDEPTLCFVVANVDAFEDAWTLPRDDLRFYLALHEVVHAALRSVPLGASAARAPRGGVRVELRDRPDGVRGGVRHRSTRATRRRSRR